MFLKHKVGCFFCSLDSTVLISVFAGFNMLVFFTSFPFAMWLCLLLCNYKMFLKHKVGFFFFSLDSTVLISIFAGFNMFQSFCKVSCCYVALFVAV